MGVQLGDLAVKHTITVDSLSGRIVAIDAFNTLYQFLASIRQEDGTPLMDSHGHVTAHLSGLFYRTARLMENGILPVYVFDGETASVQKENANRACGNQKTAEEKWKTALEEGRTEDAKKYAQATSRLTPEMVEESKVLLELMGLPHVQAPGEGEAQAAEMVRCGAAYASASQDYDSLLFGSPILVRNLSITGRRKVPRQDRYVLVEPEEIRLDETLRSLNLTREQLVMLGLLVGTDFNEGVKGVGPKTALKIVSGIKTLEDLKKFVHAKYGNIIGLGDEGEGETEEIFDVFMKPNTADVPELKFNKMDGEGLMKMLCSGHDFSEERVQRVINEVERIQKEKGGQKKLGDWF